MSNCDCFIMLGNNIQKRIFIHLKMVVISKLISGQMIFNKVEFDDIQWGRHKPD